MDLSQEQRIRIVTLYRDANYSRKKISRDTGISLTTVRRIIKRFLETGQITTNRTGRCGSKRKSSATHDRLIVRTSMRNPRLTAPDIKRQISSPLSVHVIRRRLIEGGRHCMKPISKPMLTVEMKRKRLTWARQHANWTINMWRRVIFSDESSFEVHLARPRLVRKGSEPLSPLHMVQHVKHPPKVMIWGCISTFGFGRIHVCEGNMNSQQYLHVLRTRLRIQANEWFGEQEYFFQQDNAPCHTAKVVNQYMASEGIQLLPWPSNSPDMNPIETVWGVLKEKLRLHSLTSKSDLIGKLLDMCARDTEVHALIGETCAKVIDSMPKRIEALIQSKGGHTCF